MDFGFILKHESFKFEFSKQGEDIS
jgi:hypothetical protein